MKRWMQSVPLKRAYTISTLGYTLPLLAIGIVLAFVGHGSGDRRLTRCSRRHSRQPRAMWSRRHNVTAEPQFTDLSKEYALIVLVTALLGGVVTKVMLTNVLMRETYVLVDATRTAAGGDLRPEVEVNMTNEYGMLQASVRDLFGAFRTTIGRIESAALEMRDAANEMTHTSDESRSRHRRGRQSRSARSARAPRTSLD